MGLVIALLVVLAMESQSPDLTAATFRMLVILSIVPAFLAVIVLAVGARDVPIKIKDKAKAARLSIGALNPQFRSFLFIVVIFTLGNSSDSFLILRASNLGLSVAGVLGMLITFNLVYAILAGPAGALSDRVGRRRLIVVGWLIYSVIYLGFALAANTWQVWALYGLYGLYYGLADGSARALIADLVPSEQRGTAYGFYNMAIGIVALPASLLAGILWQGIGSWAGFGPSAPFLAGAILSFVAVALFAVWRVSGPTRA
jgi:MFS family permease